MFFSKRMYALTFASVAFTMYLIRRQLKKKAAERSLEVKKSAESTSLSQEIGAFTDCEMSITSFMLAHDLLPNTEEESDSYQESSDTEIQASEEDLSEILHIPDSSVNPSLYHQSISPLQKEGSGISSRAPLIKLNDSAIHDGSLLKADDGSTTNYAHSNLEECCQSSLVSEMTPKHTDIITSSDAASEDNNMNVQVSTGAAADVVDDTEASLPMLELHFSHVSPHSLIQPHSDGSKNPASCTTLDGDSILVQTNKLCDSIGGIEIAPLQDVGSTLEGGFPKDANTKQKTPSLQEKLFPSENKTTHAHTLLSTAVLMLYFLVYPCCYTVAFFMNSVLAVIIEPATAVFTFIWKTISARRIFTSSMQATEEILSASLPQEMANVERHKVEGSPKVVQLEFADEILDKARLNEDNKETEDGKSTKSPPRVSASFLMLFLCPCLFFLLAIWLLFGKLSWDLIKLLLWLFLRIITFPPKALYSILCCILSLFRRMVPRSLGSKPGAKKRSQNPPTDRPTTTTATTGNVSPVSPGCSELDRDIGEHHSSLSNRINFKEKKTQATLLQTCSSQRSEEMISGEALDSASKAEYSGEILEAKCITSPSQSKERGHFLSDSCCCLTMLLCLVWFPFQIARKFTKAAFTYALSLFRREEEKYNASPQARGQTLEITYEDSHCINEVDETQAANPSGRLSKPAHPLLPMLCPCCYIAMCIVLYCYKIARKTFSRLTLNHTHTKCC